jgi:hypothetical protein
MVGYIYNLDTKNIHATLTSDDKLKIEAAANMICDDEHALTYTPAFGANDGLTMMCEDTNEYDLDDETLDLQEISL